jgi:hypothetical protein
MDAPIILLVRFVFLALGLSMAGLAVFIWHDVNASREFRRRLAPPAGRRRAQGTKDHGPGTVANSVAA